MYYAAACPHTLFTRLRRSSVTRCAVGTPQETDCKGGLTHTEWCDPCADGEDRLHPRAFKPEAVSHTSLHAMREEHGEKACNVSAALSWAADGFVTAARLAAGQECGAPPVYRCADGTSDTAVLWTRLARFDVLPLGRAWLPFGCLAQIEPS